MNIQPVASVIIPTYNRDIDLLDTLNGAVAQDIGLDSFEIIVIDNNSSDNTHRFVKEFIQSHLTHDIRYFLENRQGVSHARNRGVQEARGNILCFLDDDSPPNPKWLSKILEAFSDPDVGCVGGPSVLDYRGQAQPKWLKGELQGFLSAYKLPFTKPTELSDHSLMPLGCNMALRSQVFPEVGVFRTDVDRIGKDPLAVGETDLIYRVFLAGWKILYLPDASVNHIVTPDRLEKSHIYRIANGLAESFVILTSDPRPWKIIRWFASDTWYATRMFYRLVIAIINRKELWFDDYILFWVIARRIPIRLIRVMKGQFTQPSSMFSGKVTTDFVGEKK